MESEFWVSIDVPEQNEFYDKLSEALGRGDGGWQIVQRHEFADGEVSAVYGYHAGLEIAGAVVVAPPEFLARLGAYLIEHEIVTDEKEPFSMATFTPYQRPAHDAMWAIEDARKEFAAMVAGIERFNEHCLAAL